MTMSKVLKGLVLTLFLVPISYAGNESSGGGSGIVCFTSIEAAKEVRENGGVVPDKLISKIGSLQSLDLQIAYMRKDINGKSRNLFLAKEGQTVSDYLEQLMLRLEQSYPELSQAINVEMGALQQNVYFRLNPLYRIHDENDVGTEESDYCTLTNFAIQYTSGRGTIIHIDERLYSHPKHSVSSKALLLLHEYIYSALRKNGVTDSREVRDIISDIL
jgi:hypothetical protein